MRAATVLVQVMALRRRTLMLVVLILIAAIVVSYVLLTSLDTADNAYTYSKSITRNTSNTEEEHALSVAESINYAGIFNMTRLTGQGYGWQGNISDYSDYTWAQLIDSEVIDYYDARSGSLKGNAGISYTYTATVHSWGQISVAHVPKSEDANSDNTSVSILSSNGTILFQDSGWATQYAYYNGSWYQPVNASEINFNLSKSYVVEMELQYWEMYAPLAGFGSHVIQTVIMDENYQPRLLSTYSSNPIS
jgi:hypothetical protein